MIHGKTKIELYNPNTKYHIITKLMNKRRKTNGI